MPASSAVRIVVIAAVVLPLLAGCQWWPRRPADPVPPPLPQVNLPVQRESPVVPHENLAMLIAYFVRVGNLSGAALQREIAMMDAKLHIEATAARRLCLAYLLGQAAHKAENRKRAQQLLSEVEQELYTPADYKDLARFLARDLQQYAAQRESLRAEQQQRLQLQQQLDALKDIERKISERKAMPIDGVEEPKP
ncbi:hypothetical protein FKG94_26825 [Exilibacterium tricleocarpae]|uniref:Uncharacterized protein n=1 Tax=Exilibacterium tricleocarpae TaxID=2591008 RepID=A0A545SP02_9GAMM|nr:hypothetical protein [Exilibacterium tricleocarpae]TQV66712.1 hypothetical protein FKG94_26825 [Exilibacterium tricleocarpae]